MAFLDMHDVTIRYGGDPILDSISLTVERNEKVGIVGSNAAGKSTLLKAILGQVQAETGRISVEGGDPRGAIAYVPQLFPAEWTGTTTEFVLEEIVHFRERPDILEDTVRTAFNGRESKADVAIELREYTRSIGDTKLFAGASALIKTGERVAIVGPNGCGKTTLLRDIVYRGSWDDQEIRLGPSMRIGYCLQGDELFDLRRTVEDNLARLIPIGRDRLFGTLERYLFAYDDRDRPAGTLSGGERNRLHLARAERIGGNFSEYRREVGRYQYGGDMGGNGEKKRNSRRSTGQRNKPHAHTRPNQRREPRIFDRRALIALEAERMRLESSLSDAYRSDDLSATQRLAKELEKMNRLYNKLYSRWGEYKRLLVIERARSGANRGLQFLYRSISSGHTIR